MTTKKGQARRQDLLDATGSVLREYGLNGATVRVVAEKASVSPGSVLYHFDSFDALVEAAVLGVVEEFIEQRRSPANAYEDPAERILNMIQAGIPSEISSDLRIVYEVGASSQYNAKFSTHLTLLHERQVALYETAIEIGVALGVFFPKIAVRAIAMNLVALEDAYALYLLWPGKWERDQYVANTIKLAETALGCSLPSPHADSPKLNIDQNGEDIE